MIQGINLRLSQPEMIWESEKLKKYPEVSLLIDSLVTYFKQKGIIYDADLTVSNNEWKEIQSDFGVYKKRIDHTFTLRYLKRVVFYDEYIEFTISNNGIDNSTKVKVNKNFFYFFDWEKSYYD